MGRTRLPHRGRLFGCAFAALILAAEVACGPQRVPVRTAVALDPAAPIGHVDGQRFTGIRIPMTISAVATPWMVSTTYPEFLLAQGYEKEGLEQSQVFLYNPETRSSLQVSFSPADRYEEFNQDKIELLARMVTGGIEAELDAEFGVGAYRVEHAPVTPYPLGGVAYAAHGLATVEAAGTQRVNGWIFGFAEPFQLFLLYQIDDPERHTEERQALERILSTFRYTGPP